MAAAVLSHPTPPVPIACQGLLPEALLLATRTWRPVIIRAYAARGTRCELFGRVTLADPAWDILLYLAIAACDGRDATIGEICGSARSSATTALRQIDYLCDRKLLGRRPNPADRRSALVTITAAGLTKLLSLLARIDEAAMTQSGQRSGTIACLV